MSACVQKAENGEQHPDSSLLLHHPPFALFSSRKRDADGMIPDSLFRFSSEAPS